MLRVRNMRELARQHGVAAFTARLGPIVLMQKPAPEAGAEKARAWRAMPTVPLPTLSAESLPPVGRFEDLVVATLPPPLPDGTVQLLIGRNDGCNLVLDDRSASGRHAGIRWDGKKGILVELGSANGTFVNQQKVITQATLKSGDQLRFGLSTFIYLLTADFHAQLVRWPEPQGP